MRSAWVLGVALGLVVTGCAGAPPRAPGSRVGATARRPPAAAPSAVDRLAGRLDAIARQRDPLAGLAPALRSDLEGILRRLPPEELAKLAGPAGAQSPLFHLAAGGSDPEALHALATGAAPDELVAARALAGRAGTSELVPAVTALVRGAGQAFLSDAGSRLRVRPSATVCDQVDRVAAALDDLALRRLARAAAVELEPTPGRQLELARAHAWALEPERARALLARVSAGPRELDRRREVEELVSAAERVREAPQASSVASTVEVARALVALGRPRDALPLLAPRAAETAAHLGLETVSLLVELGGSACPGVPAGSETPLLCATAWGELENARSPATRLERAWASGQGRDPRAIETYLGLAHVLPWVSAAVMGADSPEQRVKRVTALALATRQAAASAPRFRGLVLFVDALRAGLESSAARRPGQRVRLAPSVQDALSAEAERMASGPDLDEFGTAGVLAAAALLMQERDVEPLIARLPAALSPRHARARAQLRLWSGVAHARLEAIEQGRAELLDATALGMTANPATSEVVLALAEVHRASVGGAPADQQLFQIASRLQTKEAPRALAWRAGLDRAGVLASGGHTAEAIAELDRIFSGAAPTAGTPEHDLYSIASVYRSVLRVRAAHGSARAAARAELSEMVKRASESAPPSLVLWAEAWRTALAPCALGRACSASSALQRAELDARAGAELGRLLARGVLPLGSVSLNFSYSALDGLDPQVSVEAALLAVEVAPSLTVAR